MNLIKNNKYMVVTWVLVMTTSFLVASQEPGYESVNSTTGDVTVTVLYDNYKLNEDLESDWGFSCLIEGLEETILFDTGGKGNILLSNLKKLSKDPEDVDIVFLSHSHQDHTGGLGDFLNVNPDVKVIMPVSFPANFKEMIKDKGAEIEEISGLKEIMEGVSTTGEMGTEIIEQSLVIQTTKGSIIITGCAHPWIIDIIKKSAEISGNNILLTMGGFHLLRTSNKDILEVIEGFRNLNVRYAGPSHCSGNNTIEKFKENYGRNFVSLGAGKVLKISEL